MKIGLYGVAFQSTNKGCEALAYSSLEILNEIAKERNEVFDVFVIQRMPTKQWIKLGLSTKRVMKTICPETEFENIKLGFILPLHAKEKIYYHPALSKLDLVLDFTEGDSFSDIYGLSRFYSDTDFKLLMMHHHIPYILGSQTVGPFKDAKVKERASEVLKTCIEVFVRDNLSYECVKETAGRAPVLTTDIAFKLPYTNPKKNRSTKVRVGFNPSGLLWQSETENSKFLNLKIDYHRYCEEIIKYFVNQNGIEISLVPHANSIRSDGSDELDSDMIPCRELKSLFPKVVLPEPFHTAMEAKSYISGLDFFIGARMHATIAALSTGVPVVPVSYSRKFEGLFGSVEYDYLVHGREDETESAIRNTEEWFENRSELRIAAVHSKEIADQKLELFIDGIRKNLKGR